MRTRALVAVLAAVLGQSLCQEVPLGELQDETVPHARSPLARLIDGIAPPKGLAEALTKSLLKHRGDLEESADLEQRWAANEAYLGRDELRARLIKAIRAAAPEQQNSLDSASAWSTQGMPMEGELAGVITEYYGADAQPAPQELLSEWNTAPQVLLDVSPEVRDDQEAVNRMLELAEIDGDQHDFQRAQQLMAKLEDDEDKAHMVKRNMKAQALTGDSRRLGIERESLQRRVERRMESEHVQLLQREADAAAAKAHSARLAAAKEMDRWVRNKGGADRESVDRKDGVAKYDTEDAQSKQAALRIAKNEAAEHPLYGEDEDVEESLAVNSSKQPTHTFGAALSEDRKRVEDLHGGGVSHEVALMEERKANKKAQNALKWALLTDDSYEKASAAAEVAEAYSDLDCSDC